MIGIFKNNIFINSLLLLPLVIVLNISLILEPQYYHISGSETVLSHWIFTTIGSSQWQNVFGILLVYIQAIYINRMVIKNRILKEITLLPGLFYIVLISFLPEFLSFSPQLISVSFLLMVMSQIFRIYRKPNVEVNIFNIGLYVGLASWFSSIFLFYISLGIMCIVTMRSMKLKEFLQLFSGLTTALLLYHGMAYLLDINSWKEYSSFYSFFQLETAILFLEMSIYKVIGYLSLVVLMVFAYRGFVIKQSVMIQKRIDMVYWLLAISGVVVLFIDSIEAMDIFVILFPLSIYLTRFFLNLKNVVIQELLFLGVLGLLYALHFDFFSWLPQYF